jgi:hypothetical protein
VLVAVLADQFFEIVEHGVEVRSAKERLVVSSDR